MRLENEMAGCSMNAPKHFSFFLLGMLLLTTGCSRRGCDANGGHHFENRSASWGSSSGWEEQRPCDPNRPEPATQAEPTEGSYTPLDVEAEEEEEAFE